MSLYHFTYVSLENLGEPLADLLLVFFGFAGVLTAILLQFYLQVTNIGINTVDTGIMNTSDSEQFIVKVFLFELIVQL